MSHAFLKDPDARLDYRIDWSAWLDGDTITASEWIIPEGIDSDEDSFTDSAATVWLEGGSEGQQYALVNRIATAEGRIADRTLVIKVRNR